MTGGMVSWRAGCGESRTSGSEGGPGRRASREACTAPWARPYFGALLWDSVPVSEPITKEHFRSLRPAILEALDHAFFDARLARTSNLERRLLVAIAADGESSPIRSVLNRTGADHPGASRLVARLVAKGLVYKPERGRLAFTVPLFGDYLRRKAIADG